MVANGEAAPPGDFSHSVVKLDILGHVKTLDQTRPVVLFVSLFKIAS